MYTIAKKLVQKEDKQAYRKNVEQSCNKSGAEVLGCVKCVVKKV